MSGQPPAKRHCPVCKCERRTTSASGPANPLAFQHRFFEDARERFHQETLALQKKVQEGKAQVADLRRTAGTKSAEKQQAAADVVRADAKVIWAQSEAGQAPNVDNPLEIMREMGRQTAAVSSTRDKAERKERVDEKRQEWKEAWARWWNESVSVAKPEFKEHVLEGRRWWETNWDTWVRHTDEVIGRQDRKAAFRDITEEWLTSWSQWWEASDETVKALPQIALVIFRARLQEKREKAREAASQLAEAEQRLAAKQQESDALFAELKLRTKDQSAQAQDLLGAKLLLEDREKRIQDWRADRAKLPRTREVLQKRYQTEQQASERDRAKLEQKHQAERQASDKDRELLRQRQQAEVQAFTNAHGSLLQQQRAHQQKFEQGIALQEQRAQAATLEIAEIQELVRLLASPCSVCSG